VKATPPPDLPWVSHEVGICEILGCSSSVQTHSRADDRANILKQYEVYGYQIAYCLLENESLAVQASTQASIELHKDHHFFHQIPSLQKQKVKRAFIKYSLTLRVVPRKQ
jgi:hypothetical protein